MVSTPGYMSHHAAQTIVNVHACQPILDFDDLKRKTGQDEAGTWQSCLAHCLPSACLCPDVPLKPTVWKTQPDFAYPEVLLGLRQAQTHAVLVRAKCMPMLGGRLICQAQTTLVLALAGLWPWDGKRMVFVAAAPAVVVEDRRQQQAGHYQLQLYESTAAAAKFAEVVLARRAECSAPRLRIQIPVLNKAVS